MLKKGYPDEETRLFMDGMKRRQKEWRRWARRQSPIITKLLMAAQRFAKKGLFKKANVFAWSAMQAIQEIDNVWINVSAEGNRYIKTVPEGWKKPVEQKKCGR